MSQPGLPVAPPGWYPDPSLRYEYRWFDGHRWTEHVARAGHTGVDPPIGSPPGAHAGLVVSRPPATGTQPSLPTSAGAGLLDEPLLRVERPIGPVGVEMEATVSDRSGQQIGTLRPSAMSEGRRTLQTILQSSTYAPRRSELVDLMGRVVLVCTRPARVFAAQLLITDPSGTEVGRIREVAAGKGEQGTIRTWVIEVGGAVAGTIESSTVDWRITVASGPPVATSSRSTVELPGGVVAARDTLEVVRPLAGPLKYLVVGALAHSDVLFGLDRRGIAPLAG